MNYREYKKSAVRHYLTCKHLLNEISSLQNDQKSYFLCNIYYLSGYVIETALTYAYFSHIKYTGDVEDSQEFQSGLKSHRFDVKIKFLREKRGDITSIPFISQKVQDDRLNLLYNSWSTDFRYSLNQRVNQKDITIDILHHYLIQLEQLLDIILRRF